MSFLQPNDKVEKLTDSDQADYVPQHPMYGFQSTSSNKATDHLDQYQEVDPFADAEFGFGDLAKAVGNATKAAKKAVGNLASKAKGAAKSIKGAAKSVLKAKKIKEAVDDAQKKVDDVAQEAEKAVEGAVEDATKKD